MFEWWANLSPKFRLAAALVPLAVSTGLWLVGTFWPYGWVLGAVLVVFSFPSAAEKKGFHDF